MIYSHTHTATMGIKGLKSIKINEAGKVDPWSPDIVGQVGRPSCRVSKDTPGWTFGRFW